MTPEQLELQTRNEDLVEKVARYIGARFGFLNGLDLDDYLNEARVGLWESACLWKSDRGTSFRGYARKRMENKILDHVRSCDEVGRSLREDGITGPSNLLDHPLIHSDADRCQVLSGFLASSDDMLHDETFEACRLILHGLDDRERMVVFLVDVMGLTQTNVGHILDLPDRMIWEMRKHALEFLRGHLSPLCDFRGVIKKARALRRKEAAPAGVTTDEKQSLLHDAAGE